MKALEIGKPQKEETVTPASIPVPERMPVFEPSQPAELPDPATPDPVKSPEKVPV